MKLHLGYGSHVEPWKAVRQARSRPPYTSRSGLRRKTFSASLEQADDLWRASAALSPLTSPVLQYYSLYQVARAVLAGSPLSNSDWQPRNGHGLGATVETCDGDPFEAIFVEPNGQGLASKLAEALGSPLLEEKASLASLIASLPHQKHYLPDHGHQHALCLYAVVPRGHQDPHTLVHTPAIPRIRVGPVPGDFPRHMGPLSTSDGKTLWAPGPSWGDVVDLRTVYPELKTFPRPSNIDTWWSGTEEGGTHLDLVYDGQLPDSIWGTAEVYDDAGHYLMPVVGGNSRPQHPLVAWLLILFGLSMVSRYYPARWRDTLDFDKNRRAVEINDFINEGCLEAVFVAGRTLSMLSLLGLSGGPVTPVPEPVDAPPEVDLLGAWLERLLSRFRHSERLVALAADGGESAFAQDPEVQEIIRQSASELRQSASELSNTGGVGDGEEEATEVEVELGDGQLEEMGRGVYRHLKAARTQIVISDPAAPASSP